MNDKVLKSKWLILFLIFQFTWQLGTAQYSLKNTVHAGMIESEFEGSYFAKFMKLKPFTGKFFGYTITADFDRKYELSTGFYISEKGYKASFRDVYYYDDDIFPDSDGSIEDKKAKYRFDEDLELTYLEFPFVVKKRITPLAAVMIGFNVNILLNSSIANKYVGYKVRNEGAPEEKVQFYRLGRKSDASFYFGAEIRATDWIGLTLHYEYGLINQDYQDLTDTRINAWRIGLFYVFSKH